MKMMIYLLLRLYYTSLKTPIIWQWTCQLKGQDNHTKQIKIRRNRLKLNSFAKGLKKREKTSSSRKWQCWTKVLSSQMWVVWSLLIGTNTQGEEKSPFKVIILLIGWVCCHEIDNNTNSYLCPLFTLRLLWPPRSDCRAEQLLTGSARGVTMWDDNNQLQLNQ